MENNYQNEFLDQSDPNVSKHPSYINSKLYTLDNAVLILKFLKIEIIPNGCN